MQDKIILKPTEVNAKQVPQILQHQQFGCVRNKIHSKARSRNV